MIHPDPDTQSCPTTSAWPDRKISSKAALVHQTLAYDYPAIDYLGIRDIIRAKHKWFKILWFAIVFILLASSLFTVYRIIREYIEKPTAINLSVKSVEQMLLPQVTVCPTTPMTVNVTLLAQTMRAQPQFNAITDQTVLDFAEFMIAGSGFQKMDAFVQKWDIQYINYLTSIYDTMRQSVDTRTFFYKFFDIFGLQCTQVFQFCKLGQTVLDCCQIFQPAYTIRRGRCFKTAVPLYQRSLDELGKFRIQMRNPAIMNISHDPEDEMLLFIGDAKPDIEPYPRYYLYERQYNKFRLMARHFHLLPGSEHCSDEYSTVGKATCYLTKWLVDNLENPYHCTYPYMDKIRNVSLQSCDAEVLVEHYENTVNAKSYYSHDCTLPCTRWEYTITVDRTEGPPADDSTNNPAYAFRADISFDDLQYEEITEVHSLTFFGLLAQIGGQLSLFLGTSIMTIIQVFLMLLILSKRVCTGRRNSTRIVMTPATEAEVKRNPSEGEMTRANNFYVSSPDFYAPISKRGLRPDEPTNDTVPRTETTIY